MPKPIRIVIHGREFPTIVSAADAYGLGRQTVYKRIRKLNWGVERALITKPMTNAEAGRMGKAKSSWMKPRER